MTSSKKKLLLSAILSIALAATLSSAKADNSAGPAVAAPNFNIGTAAAVLDGDAKFLLSGRGTMPLYSDAFGFQIDGSEALGAGPNRGGLALHLFQRDPSRHLLGLTTMWGRVGSLDTFRFGAEGEAYLQDFTVRLAGGSQNQEGHSTGYANAKVSFYATDNLVFALSGAGYSNSRSGGVDVEWKPSGTFPFSLFAAGGDTNDSDGFALLGLRFSFGDNGASLKDRQRKYDPDNIVETFMTNENGGASDSCGTPNVIIDGGGPFAIADGGGPPAPCGGNLLPE